MRIRLTWVSMLMVGLAVLIGGCSRVSQGPVQIALSDLVQQEDAYDGAVVRTAGIVRVFGGDNARRHYVIEDAAANRVALAPGDEAASHLNQRVEVVGRFQFDEATGRVIHIQEIGATPTSEPDHTARSGQTSPTRAPGPVSTGLLPADDRGVAARPLRAAGEGRPRELRPALLGRPRAVLLQDVPAAVAIRAWIQGAPGTL